MNKDEIAKIFAKLNVIYPHHYKLMSPQETKILASTWHGIFKDYESSVIYSAINKYIETNTTGFPPVPAQIKTMVDETLNPQLTESEAWELVERATDEITDWDSSRGRKAWESLPPPIKRALPYRTFLAWGEQPIDQTSYLQTKFNKSYQEVLKHKDELLQLENNPKSKELGNSVFKQLDG